MIMDNIEDYTNCPVYTLLSDISKHVQKVQKREYKDVRRLNDISINNISIKDMVYTNVKVFENFKILEKINNRLISINVAINHVETLYFHIKTYTSTLRSSQILDSIVTRYENAHDYVVADNPDDTFIALAINSQRIQKDAILNAYYQEIDKSNGKIRYILVVLIEELKTYGNFIYSRLEYYNDEVSKAIKNVEYNGFEKKYIVLLVCVRKNYNNYSNKMLEIITCIKYLEELKDYYEMD